MVKRVEILIQTALPKFHGGDRTSAACFTAEHVGTLVRVGRGAGAVSLSCPDRGMWHDERIRSLASRQTTAQLIRVPTCSKFHPR